MCAICHSAPCHPRCPNAPDPIAIDDCYLCDSPIREGEEYYTIGDVSVCKHCAETMTMNKMTDITGLSASEILYEIGGELKVGEAD